MSRYKGRKERKMAEMERAFRLMTDSYCPECGAVSRMVSPYDPDSDGGRVTFDCPECGPFTVIRTDDGWTVEGTGVPYIMYADTNAATLLHRYDPSDYPDERTAVTEHIRLLCETAIARSFAEETDRSHALMVEAMDLTLGAFEKGVSDARNDVTFGCIHLYLTKHGRLGISAEECRGTVDRLLGLLPLLDPVTAVGLLAVCEDYTVQDGGDLDGIGAAYDALRQREPGTDGHRDRIYWEGMCLMAAFLGRKEEFPELFGKLSDSWRRFVSRPESSEEDLDALNAFLITIFGPIEDDSYDLLLDRMLEVVDSIPGRSYVRDSMVLLRYEHRLMNGLHPYDRLDDIDSLIERYSEPENPIEAALAVKAHVHRAQEAEDPTDALEDMSAAMNLVIASKLQDTGYRDLVIDMGAVYMEMTEDDKKLQRSLLLRLKRIGITKEMLRTRRRESDLLDVEDGDEL